MKRLGRRRRKQLTSALEEATSYAEWRRAAEALDHATGLDVWRADDQSPHYRADVLRDDIARFDALEREGRVVELLVHLEESLYRSLNEVLEPELHQTANAGTKHLVERWLARAESAIEWAVDTPLDGWPAERKLERIHAAYRNLGRSALLLSGGATLGFYHIGVVRALWSVGLLPEVIVGASMGAMVAAGIACRTDEELRRLFEADRVAIQTRGLEWRRLSDAHRTRSLMKPERMLSVIEANCGRYTFAEAHARSGRTLNISLMPTRTRQKPRLLCHLTAPDVWVPRAALASSAVPGLFPPVALTRKPHGGEGEVPYIDGETWIDGSFGADLPTMRVGRLHNVNHFIVSQTQPHAVLAMTGEEKRGLVKLATDTATRAIQAQGAHGLALASRVFAQTPIGAGLSLAQAVIQQDYRGDIDIFPRFDLSTYTKLLTNPSEEDLAWYVAEGERATWPRVSIVRDSTRIARCLARCERRLRARVEA